MAYEIRPLDSGNLEAYIRFFRDMPFPHHPHWDCCFCYSFHFTGRKEQWNRENNLRSVRSMVPKGEMKGYLAYRGNDIVGWCNANNRNNYARLPLEHELPEPGRGDICSPVCFLVHPNHRHKGLAGALLDRVCADYCALGYTIIEAYPRKDPADEESRYPGSLKMYQDRGFLITAEEGEHYIVRKDLNSVG
jgi:GNAT superfamily N-acetyltransferase